MSFNPGTNDVTIGGAAIGNRVVVNDTTITGTAPAGTPGVKNVTVSNANGSATLVNAFTYVVPALYGVQRPFPPPGTSSTLFTINPSTGGATTIGGMGVVIGARVGAAAGPSEVFVSQTVKDLVAGSGLGFEDAGEHELKGVPDRWRLYRVVS